MASKKEIKLLTELLELSGVKVVSRHQHKGIGILLQIEPITQESMCHRCGKKAINYIKTTNIAILNDFLCIGVLIDFGKIKFMFLGEKIKHKFDDLTKLI